MPNDGNRTSSGPQRFAYADPPYPGQAKRLYGNHPDYAGEVDHGKLIYELARDYDGWALSTSMKALPAILKMCLDDVLVHAWVKPLSPPMGDNRIYSWEPVIVRPLRNPPTPTRMHLIASPPGFTFRATPGQHVTGEKPEAFARWLFTIAGLEAADDFTDLFPGSGAIGRAWDAFRAQGVLAI